ncbi:hypothetical protein [Acidiferrobacter sp.]|jgi:hypothetical protein|uniref:hypothetical protein n=1 Tax=Acidiferrobacter sp. TaxID=1872107 RepID=UPI0026117B7C|nr:hypothetical protein [Acidiferrobacter sp.]
MIRARHEPLPDILAALRALAADLKNDAQIGDDGIPVLTTVIANPTRPDIRPRAVGAPIPTLSHVVTRLATTPDPETAHRQTLSARIRAAAIAQRVDSLWRADGNDPLDPAMMATLERALTQALQELA